MKYISNLFKTLFKLFRMFLTSPIQFIKQISIQNFLILIRAVRNESPRQIIENFRRLLILGNKNLLHKENIFSVIDKNHYQKNKIKELDSFLKSGEILDFSNKGSELSIILVLYNQAELTFACLNSLKKHCITPFDLIIIDNNSDDLTPKLLGNIKGASVVRNKENLHFLRACNQAFEYANTTYTLVLNNDTEIIEHTIESALERIKSDSKIGAVGGKIILPNGKLQEAGSIIWNDASCLGYGRGDSPAKAEFNFVREVDYCSAAFLLNRTELIKKHNGFDTLFEPAYYEETDFCLWLKDQDFKVVYEPKAVICHFEFGSGNNENAIKLQQQNQKKFYNKHQEILKTHYSPSSENILHARISPKFNKKKVLYIDDRLPLKSIGAGFPRASQIINSLHKLGYFISIIPLNFPIEEENDNFNPYIEIITTQGKNGFEEFIKSRINYYDFIWISRPHNMKSVAEVLKKIENKSRIIYDAEAIFIEREIMKREMIGNPISTARKDKLYKNEIEQSKNANTIVCVSKNDKTVFQSFGVKRVLSLGHAFDNQSSKTNFTDRKNLLFVGNLDDETSPNVDSLNWFLNDVFPLIQKSIPEIKLIVVGSAKAMNVSHPKIEFLGQQNELSELYESHKVFIAPTRFAAGIPYKVHESAAFGLPVVATELLGKQLNWNNNTELLLSAIEPNEFAKAVIELYSNETLWNKLQKNALDKIKNEHSIEVFENTIDRILNNDVK